MKLRVCQPYGLDRGNRHVLLGRVQREGYIRSAPTIGCRRRCAAAAKTNKLRMNEYLKLGSGGMKDAWSFGPWSTVSQFRFGT